MCIVPLLISNFGSGESSYKFAMFIHQRDSATPQCIWIEFAIDAFRFICARFGRRKFYYRDRQEEHVLLLNRINHHAKPLSSRISIGVRWGGSGVLGTSSRLPLRRKQRKGKQHILFMWEQFRKYTRWGANSLIQWWKSECARSWMGIRLSYHWMKRASTQQ